MIRILIVDDSALMRRVLREVISACDGIEVAGEASNGLAGCEQNIALRPDFVIMDLDMPVMDGVAATARIMRERPVPILVFSAAADSPTGFAALGAGARDVLRKPDFDSLNDDAFRSALYERITCIARSSPRPTSGVGTAPAEARAYRGVEVGAIVIGASTGGPVAVRTLLASLPAAFPVGIALVQHLEDGFDEGYARWLDESCDLRVRLATVGRNEFEPGAVVVAPGNRHLAVRDGLLVLEDGPRVGNQKPAVDVLFDTAAAYFGKALVGALLTGMGRDGADGCKRIVDAGGRTLVQDQATSAIFGMPRAAIELGAATEVLPLDSFAPRLVALATKGTVR